MGRLHMTAARPADGTDPVTAIRNIGPAQAAALAPCWHPHRVPTCARSAQMRLYAAILRSGTGPHFIAYEYARHGIARAPLERLVRARKSCAFAKASTPSWHKRTEPMPARRKASTPFLPDRIGHRPPPLMLRCYIAPHACNAAKLIQVKQMPPLKSFKKILARAFVRDNVVSTGDSHHAPSDADSNHRPCHRFCRCGPRRRMMTCANSPMKLFDPIPITPPDLPEQHHQPSGAWTSARCCSSTRALSRSGLFSCQSCHNVGLGGGDGLETSIGHGWQAGPRATRTTVYNAVFNIAQSWERTPRAQDPSWNTFIFGPWAPVVAQASR